MQLLSFTKHSCLLQVTLLAEITSNLWLAELSNPEDPKSSIDVKQIEIYNELAACTLLELFLALAGTLFCLGYFGATPEIASLEVARKFGYLLGLPEFLAFVGLILDFGVIAFRIEIMFPTSKTVYIFAAAFALMVVLIGIVLAWVVKKQVDQALQVTSS